MLVSMSAFIVSCGGSSSSDSDPLMSDEDAAFCDNVTEAVSTAVSNFTNPAGFPNLSPAKDIGNKVISEIIDRRASASAGTGSWNNAVDVSGELKASGTYEFDNAIPSYHYVMTITFSDYEYVPVSGGDKLIIKGTVILEGTKNEVSDIRTITTTYKENLTVKAGTVERTINSDYVTTVIKNYITNVKQSTKTGTYELDGKSFRADESEEEEI